MLRLFKGHDSRKGLLKYSKQGELGLSKVAEVDGKFAGFYLLRKGSVMEVLSDDPEFAGITVYEDLDPYRGKRGVEGVALAVLPEFRGSGVGRALMDAPKSMGFDYIYGYQFKSLGNLQNWLGRRRLVAETTTFYCTLQDLHHGESELLTYVGKATQLIDALMTGSSVPLIAPPRPRLRPRSKRSVTRPWRPRVRSGVRPRPKAGWAPGSPIFAEG
jgi:GNAT superfamily N-acetyltransferase